MNAWLAPCITNYSPCHAYSNYSSLYPLLWLFSLCKEKVPVILVAGQSNADGRVPIADLPEELKTYKYCQWSYGSGNYETADGSFSLFSPRVAKTKIEASWGFDAVVYRLVLEL